MPQKKSANDADQKLDIVLRRLDVEKLRCFDTETSGLDPKRCHPVGYVFTFSPDPKDSYYVPIRHAPGGNVGGMKGPQDRHGWDRKPTRAESALLKKLDQPGTLNFGHNIAFDLKFTWEAGMRELVARWEDTIINAPLLDEWQGRYSLEACANLARVFAKKSREIEEHIVKLFPNDCEIGKYGDKAPMAHYWRLAGDDPVAVDYAQGDGTSTWQLRDWQMPQLEAQDLMRVHDVESRLISVLARMSIRGVRVDEERLAQLIVHTDEEIARLTEEFWPEFNARSPLDVERYLTDNGVRDWEYSPGRLVRQADGSTKRVPQKSFKEQWLLTTEPGKKIVKVRKLETLKSSFLMPMVGHVFEGRVHPNYWQLRTDEFGTVTGRLSCSDPNLQAVTKHDVEVGKLHRSIFLADPGLQFKTVDYSQIEPRLLAFYTGAKTLWDGYLADPPVDAHTSVSMQANRKWDTLSKDEQKHYRNNFGKRINQTVITGGGKGVLVKKYNVPANEVNQMLRDYHRVMPELRPFQKGAAATFRLYRHVFSLLGRRARLINPDFDYTATNRLLQCGNADIIKLKMVETDDYLASIGRPEGLDLLNNIHDDLCWQVAPKMEPEFQRCLEIMTACGRGDVIDLSRYDDDGNYIDTMPITVDVGSGDDWAEATYSFKWPGGQPPYMQKKRGTNGKEGKGTRGKAAGSLKESAYSSKADKKRQDRERAGV